MPGRRRASSVLPLPGGPTKSRLWPPAAATSSARLARSCPCTSARSGSTGAAAGISIAASGRSSAASPRSQASAAPRLSAASAARPGQSAASPRFPRGTTTSRIAAPSAAASIASTPRTASQRAVEAELAEEERALELRRLELDPRAGDRERDRQVERGADLGHAGRREVHRHAARRELESALAERGADPVAALVHHAVGLADDVERGQTSAGLDLDRDAHALDHVKRRAERAHEHGDSARDRRCSSECRGASAWWRGPVQCRPCRAGVASRSRSGWRSPAAATARRPRCPRRRRRSRFDGARAFRDLEALVRIGPRPAGSNGAEQARALIRERLRQAGWLVEAQTFRAAPPGGGKPVAMVNLVAQRSARRSRRCS